MQKPFRTEVASRIGALAAAKPQFTLVEDSLSDDTFREAVDSVISGVAGLAAVTVIRPDGTLSPSAGSLLGRTWADPLSRPVLANAFQKALRTRQPTATGDRDEGRGPPDAADLLDRAWLWARRPGAGRAPTSSWTSRWMARRPATPDRQGPPGPPGPDGGSCGGSYPPATTRMS